MNQARRTDAFVRRGMPSHPGFHFASVTFRSAHHHWSIDVGNAQTHGKSGLTDEGVRFYRPEWNFSWL